MKKDRIRELYRNYADLLQPWQIKLAIGRMRRFQIPEDAWDDTMQELAMRIVKFRFDPKKAGAASEETILCRRLDRRIKELARANVRYLVRHQRLAQLRQTVEDVQTPDVEAEANELHELLEQLTPKQRVICQGLIQGKTVNQIAKSLGQDWYVVERQINHIRQFLVERGYGPCEQ